MKRFWCLSVATAVLAAPVHAAFQQPAAGVHSASLFGMRDGVEQASLSPDATKIAYLAPLKGRGTALFVGPLDGSAEPQPILSSSGDPERLASCRWSAETRLVCTVWGVERAFDGEPVYFTRQLALDSDGKNVKVLINRGGTGAQLGDQLDGGAVIDWLPGEDGAVLMTRDFVPQTSTGSLLGQQREGLGVVRVNTRSSEAEIVETPRKGATEFITDGRGVVRIMGMQLDTAAGYLTGNTRYSYRAPGSREWQVLSTVELTGSGFNPYGVDPAQNVAYGLKKLNGRTAAYQVALDGSLKETLVFAHPQVDVDGFVGIGRQHRLIGVTYVTDKREVVYFDPALKQLAQSLSRAIPDLPLIRFVDSSVDETKLLIHASSDINPGRYYLFDRGSKRLAELMPSRPALDAVALAPVRHISYRAADGTVIPGYLTLPPGKADAKGLPAIVMPHGGPGARDEWGFDWLAQYFANRGYAVLQPNFRGSAGYGDAWFQKNGFQSWRTAIGDVDNGGRWLVAEGIADSSKMAIVGWSYGGYAALQSATTEPGLFKAVVAIAPVTDLEMFKEDWRNFTNYQVVSRFVGDGPHVVEGSPARNAAKIKVPVLMFHGTVDRNVRIGHARLMASRLKEAGARAELVTFDGLDHYLEDSAARTDMLQRSDQFLRSTMGI